MADVVPSTDISVARKPARTWQKLLPWLITLVCFGYLYEILHRAAAKEGSTLAAYLAKSFESVSWTHWLALMIPYSICYLIFDSAVVWQVVNWFNAKIRYVDILPIRASAYILSLINEQVSKGAIAFYLNRRFDVPVWEVGSSMLFIMFCEFYSLIAWGTFGVLLQWNTLPTVFHAIPWVALGSVIFFAIFHLFFTGRIFPGIAFRNRPIFSSFRKAKIWQYAAVLALRAPLMIAGVITYTLALNLFGGGVSFTQMLGYLPVVFMGAAMPGPMRSVAITFWVLLFPSRPGQMAIFGFVQHNFFILFNAGIGLLFLRRATRELFGEDAKG
jgi:hypothetical protein